MSSSTNLGGVGNPGYLDKYQIHALRCGCIHFPVGLLGLRNQTPQQGWLADNASCLTYLGQQACQKATMGRS